jgi:hypothetical protein
VHPSRFGLYGRMVKDIEYRVYSTSQYLEITEGKVEDRKAVALLTYLKTKGCCLSSRANPLALVFLLPCSRANPLYSCCCCRAGKTKGPLVAEPYPKGWLCYRRGPWFSSRKTRANPLYSCQPFVFLPTLWVWLC